MILKDVITALQKMHECMCKEGIDPKDVEVTGISLCDECSVRFETPDDAVEEMTLFEGKLSYTVNKPQERKISLYNDLSESYHDTYL